MLNKKLNKKKIIEGAAKLKVCGHPVRLQLLMLIEKEEVCVSDIWQKLNKSQPVISQHLSILKKGKVVKSEVSGNKRLYRVVDPLIKKILKNLQD